MRVTIDEEKGEVTIVLPLEKKPEPTDSGKNVNIASTHGTIRSEAEYQGEVVKVGANVLIRNKDYVKPAKEKRQS